MTGFLISHANQLLAYEKFVKNKKRKCEKMCFALVFIMFRKGRHVEKKARTSTKTQPKKHKLLIQKVAKIKNEKSVSNGVSNAKKVIQNVK